MAGYIRGSQPAALDRASVERFAAAFVAEELLPDPFAVAHDCVNPRGHHFIPSCGDLACSHCGRIAWP